MVWGWDFGEGVYEKKREAGEGRVNLGKLQEKDEVIHLCFNYCLYVKNIMNSNSFGGRRNPTHFYTQPNAFFGF